jgi:hypothetical protein
LLCSISQIYDFVLETFQTVGGVPHFLAYDDACHLSKYVFNKVRFEAKNVNALQRLLARSTTMVVDPFHFPGHKDPSCKQFNDPGAFKELDKINMEVRFAIGPERACARKQELTPQRPGSRPGTSESMTRARAPLLAPTCCPARADLRAAVQLAEQVQAHGPVHEQGAPHDLPAGHDGLPQSAAYSKAAPGPCPAVGVHHQGRLAPLQQHLARLSSSGCQRVQERAVPDCAGTSTL